MSVLDTNIIIEKIKKKEEIHENVKSKKDLRGRYL